MWTRSVIVMAAMLPTVSAATVSGDTLSTAERVRPYLDGLAASLDARSHAAIGQMADLGRQLLAARAYLRGSATLSQRWSWTDAQISAFEGSTQQRELVEQIALVRTTFERLNPGYTLFVNEQVRSLEVQLERWNSNESVAGAAAHLEAAAVEFLEASGWPPPLQRHAVETFARFLDSYVPEPTPTLAAPGLSPHGQMRAVDFHVYQGDREIAAPEAASIQTVWQQGRWAAKLHEAVEASGASFRGPLLVPDEPWHYDYTR